ncbi:hypothetical protein SAMN05216232_3576 [Virgibacillus subterraneus]|uniref:DUF3888 domain-containing protein n=1 Tax=Virgibacillus subterraneus TaxID=621109 RepID=A0A1H9JPM6_9BACI|nr:hypothetical protein [Virgibacillus subterraneus]SEQ88757.1 hypothetical protein SAMN05216232_3576 [Virgibacillus subterraneus]
MNSKLVLEEANAEVSIVKKLTITSICLILFLGLTPNEYNAQTGDDTEDDLLESYAAAEEIILYIIKPDVEQILRDKYSERFILWHYANKEIVNLKLVHKKLDPRWFEITVSVIYNFKNTEGEITDGQAHIKLKVLPTVFSRHNKETEIKLINIFNIAERVM